MGVEVVFLPDCSLVLSLLKHRGVRTFLNKKMRNPNKRNPLNSSIDKLKKKKKKKRQHYNFKPYNYLDTHLLTLSVAAQAPNSPSPINVYLLSLSLSSLLCLRLHCLLLATTISSPLISQFLECHSFLSLFRYSQEVLQKISNFDAPPYNAFFEVCLCILFSMVLNDL